MLNFIVGTSIYSTIVLKDVTARKKASDPVMLESVVRFALDNIGSLLSTKKMQTKRYNIKGKQYLKIRIGKRDDYLILPSA